MEIFTLIARSDIMTWQEILKNPPPLDTNDEKEINELMRFRNMDRQTAERTIRRKKGKLGQRKQATYADYMRSRKEEVLNFKRRFKKVVTNKKTGRKKTVKFGQAGKAKDGGDRIRPNTPKADSYCARSNKIKGNWRSDPNSPNNLSRKNWKCHGNKSSK